jgi:succinate-semialdehyde dehydrogenase/glutarate-semialdehyde dehydrogenase
MYEDLWLYIDGEFIKGGGRREQDVMDPATGDLLGRLPHATTADLDRALVAAQRAFDAWKKCHPREEPRPAQGRRADARARQRNPEHHLIKQAVIEAIGAMRR